MSYIQIEIGGKLRGLKFNQGALIIMKELNDLDAEPAFTGYALVYAGLKANAYVKKVEFVDTIEVEEDGKKIKKQNPITFEMVCDWVDELPEAVLISAMDCFKETQMYKNTLEPEEVKEDDKKKLITEPIASGSPADG